MKIVFNNSELELVKVNHNAFHDSKKSFFFKKVKYDYTREWKSNGTWKEIKNFIPAGFYQSIIEIEGNWYFVHKYISNIKPATINHKDEIEKLINSFNGIEIGYCKRTKVLNAFYKYQYEFIKSEEYLSNKRKYNWLLAYVQRIISTYIRKEFVLCHNAPISRNIGIIDGKPYFIDIEDIGGNVKGWDQAVYHNSLDIPISESEHELREIHAFIWWMKFYSLSERDQKREVNIEYYANLKEMWEEAFSYNKTQENYWDRKDSEYKYFSKLIKSHDMARLNELMLFHKYWTRDLFLRQYIYEESKVKYRHEFKEMPLYKKYGRLRNNVVHRLREDEFIKMYTSIDKYYNLFFEVMKDLFTIYKVPKIRFINFLERLKFNKYLIDYKQRIKIINFVQERFVDLKIIERGEANEF